MWGLHTEAAVLLEQCGVSAASCSKLRTSKKLSARSEFM